ncbi:gamma-glutamyltransferase [Ahrensia sp. R2A130]|uniref:gamma-glutamyltransferase n=1 Tax=Ahrensia sp. R2A130 TaxID=744979 RepID=UPI0001E09C6A|nr:gamma-glutamyltransferase [Ahrensia sp. R2A130]EFL88597.1 gamma-glutamyltransferase [Ahrensia sp. R2A130]
MRDLERPGRSPVMSTNGMAATSHPLSSQVAIDILKAGGNALDAAIAACAMQCVVEPGSTGIGGDCFAMYAPAARTKDVICFNGSGRAPAAATREKLAELGVTEFTRTSAHSVIIPGAIDAWATLNADHGKLPLADLLQPAIDAARNGYPISQRVHADFEKNADHLDSDENLKAIYKPGGKIPPLGSVHKNPKLAEAMAKIAAGGRDAFYTGALAQEMVDTLQAKGGLHTMEDFASAKGTYETPISTQYEGKTVLECPPQGQGVIALLMLNMASSTTLGSEVLSADRIHNELEICRRGYASRGIYLADPAQADVPVDGLLSAEYARQLVDDIDPVQAKHLSDALNLKPHHDTVYITVVDKDRNVASFINTLFWGFGSGITTPEHGIILTNRGEGFVLEEGHPNCIAPGKRPLHTIIPGMVADGDKISMGFGVMGGEYQAMGHLQFLSRTLHDGMDVQEAQDWPRWMVDPYTGEVEIEGAVPQDVFEELQKRGHNIARATGPIGGSQAVEIDWENGVLIGGSDPRKDGCAIGY